jgi:hypothetical protein
LIFLIFHFYLLFYLLILHLLLHFSYHYHQLINHFLQIHQLNYYLNYFLHLLHLLNLLLLHLLYHLQLLYFVLLILIIFYLLNQHNLLKIEVFLFRILIQYFHLFLYCHVCPFFVLCCFLLFLFDCFYFGNLLHHLMIHLLIVLMRNFDFFYLEYLVFYLGGIFYKN